MSDLKNVSLVTGHLLKNKFHCYFSFQKKKKTKLHFSENVEPKSKNKIYIDRYFFLWGAFGKLNLEGFFFFFNCVTPRYQDNKVHGQGLLKYIHTESTEFAFFPYHTQLAVLFIFLFYAVMTLTCPIYICVPGVNPELKDNLIF